MNSNELIAALLEAQLDGNAIKVVLAYVKVGGWKDGQEVYLSRKHYQEYGISKRTVSRHRVELINKGWLIPTGNKSMDGFDKYTVQIPSTEVVPDCQGGRANLARGVGQNGTGGGSNWPTEVIKEVTKEVMKSKEDDSASAPSSTIKDESNKEDQDPASLIGSDEQKSLPILLKTGPAPGSPVDRWKRKNGIKTVETAGPEWAQPGYKAPVAVLEKPTCPMGGTCGGGDLCWCK